MSLSLLHSVPAAEPLGTWSSTGKPLPWQPGEGGAAPKYRNLSPILVLHFSYHTELISQEKQTWQGLSAATSEQGENVCHCWKQLHWLVAGARVSVKSLSFSFSLVAQSPLTGFIPFL